MKDSPRILIVDDDPEIATMLARALARRGFRIDSTSSPDDALSRALTTAYDGAILDLVMPGRDGVQLAAELRVRIPGLPIALLTGYTHSPLIPGAERAGIAVFAKPVATHELADFLEKEIGD